MHLQGCSVGVDMSVVCMRHASVLQPIHLASQQLPALRSVSAAAAAVPQATLLMRTTLSSSLLCNSPHHCRCSYSCCCCACECSSALAPCTCHQCTEPTADPITCAADLQGARQGSSQMRASGASWPTSCHTMWCAQCRGMRPSPRPSCLRAQCFSPSRTAPASQWSPTLGAPSSSRVQAQVQTSHARTCMRARYVRISRVLPHGLFPEGGSRKSVDITLDTLFLK
jgi:hypothetical protein